MDVAMSGCQRWLCIRVRRLVLLWITWIRVLRRNEIIKELRLTNCEYKCCKRPSFLYTHTHRKLCIPIGKLCILRRKLCLHPPWELNLSFRLFVQDFSSPGLFFSWIECFLMEHTCFMDSSTQNHAEALWNYLKTSVWDPKCAKFDQKSGFWHLVTVSWGWGNPHGDSGETLGGHG